MFSRNKFIWLVYHEIFIIRSWYSVLPSLDATISCRIKKAVIGVTQLITALVSIHSSMTFLADMYSFLDSPSRTVFFSVVFFQPIVWLTWFAWSVSADLLYSVRLAVSWIQRTASLTEYSKSALTYFLTYLLTYLSSTILFLLSYNTLCKDFYVLCICNAILAVPLLTMSQTRKWSEVSRV